MIIYILKASACLAILMLFYKVFLERSSIHTAKRFYLLTIIALSFTIPLITFTQYVEVDTNTSPLVVESFSLQPEMTYLEPEKTFKDYLPNILWAIYFFGVTVFLVRFLSNLKSLINRISHNPKIKELGFTYVLLNKLMNPHSFFKYIFLNKEQYNNNNIPNEVLIHEQVHAKEMHAMDILFIEIVQILLWFNPLIYLLRDDIKLNHEFLADRAVINNGVAYPKYRELLLSYSTGQNSQVLTNSINYSLIKKRFEVMNIKTSKHRTILFGMLLLPIMTVLIYGFHTKEVKYLTSSEPTRNQSIMSNQKVALIEIRQDSIFIDGVFSETGNFKEDFLSKFGPFSNEESKKNLYVSLQIYPKANQPLYDATFRTILDLGINNVVLRASEYGHGTMTSIGTNSKYNIVEVRSGNMLKFPSIESNTDGFINTMQNAGAIFYYKSQKIDPVGVREILANDNLKLHVHTIWDQDDEATPPMVLINEYYGQYPNKENEESLNTIENQSSSNVPVLVIYPNNRVDVGLKNPIKIEELDQYYKIKLNQDGEIKSLVLWILDEVEQFDLERVHKILDDFNIRYSDEVLHSWKDLPKEKKEEILQFISKAANRTGGGKSMNDNEISKSHQDKATEDEVKEYNRLAKKYNEMDRNKMNIQKSEIDRLTNIYNRMTVSQRNNAEPFPQIPEPPKPPKIPTFNEKKSNSTKKMEEKLPPPPPPKFEPNPKTNINRASSEQTIPDPPPPPAPEDPIDHIIRMAKNNAAFYYEGKPIDSDKAIEVVKNNKKINIQVREEQSTKPTVLISTNPIYIKQKPQDKVITVNGKTPKDNQVVLNKKEIIDLKLKIKDLEVTEYKLKIPGVKTLFLKSDGLDEKAKKIVSTLEDDSFIQLFDIKTSDDKKNKPIMIHLKD